MLPVKKRTASGGSSSTSKRAKTQAKAAPPPLPSSEEDSDLELDGEGDEDSDDGRDGGEEEDEDSEVNEFELEGSDDGSEDDLIGDDGEDLMARVGDDDEDDDDDDDDEDDEVVPVVAPAPLKKANVRNSRAAAPLKPAELRALAFAELTASPISTLIATQVSMLLTPVAPPTPATSPLQPLLKSLHAHITTLPPVKASSLARLAKKGAMVPPVKGLDGKWGKVDLEWEKPRAEDVRVVGRWAWGGSLRVKGEYVVDMAIAMPATLLQSKDYLSPRFLIKSTHYLVTLSSLLPSSLGPVALSYVQLPSSMGWALEIRSATVKGDEKIGLAVAKGAVLRLRVVWPVDCFPANKLGPLSNVARPASSSDENLQIAPSDLPATPLQSTSLHFASLALLTSHLKFHHALTISHPSYSSTLRLLQLWATRRGFGASLGLSDDFWSWCVARTLDWGSSKGTGGAASGGDAWAGWRKVTEWLAGVDWVAGVFFRVEGSPAYPKDDLRKAFAGKALFVDPTGTVNLAAGIDLSTLEMISQDAKTTIAILLTTVEDEDKFDAIFLREIRECERFDNYARITLPTDLSTLTDADLDHPDQLSYIISSVSSTIRRALGTRAKAFHLTAPATPSLPTRGRAPSSSPIVLTLGILLDATESGRLVDQGPSAEDEPACEEFRSFWGPKSELRRFKDGSILESVVWDEMSSEGMGQQRNKVASQVVEYILATRHSATVEIFAAAMDHLIVEPHHVRQAVYVDDSVATGKGFGNIMGAYDELVKELKELPDLPLSVSSVQASSSGLRYSTLFTPSGRRLKQFERFAESTKYIEIHDILLTLEGSGRWPDDLEGVQKIKSAFLAKMAEGLSELHSVTKADVVFDLDARAIDDNVSLEILTTTGFAFRARISYDRSALLLQSQAGGTFAGDSPTDLYQERFVHAPRHHNAIATLQHTFTSYSHTVRLVKRWFSSHMLSPNYPSEVLELLVASVFLDPSTLYEPPQSGATGFARVMDKLSSWDWREEPLTVALYSFQGAVTSGRRPCFPPLAKAIATTHFRAHRAEDPSISEFAWRVCTEEDPKGMVWGRRTDRVVAGRTRGLARATLKALNEGLVSGSLVVDQLFSPPLGDYNFLIHLDATVVPRYFQSISPDPNSMASRSSRSILSGSIMGQVDSDSAVRLAYDPVAAYVQELQRLYPSVFLLFYSPDGSPTIGGIWNPSATSPRSFSVGMGFPSMPVLEEGANKKAKVALDKDALLREVRLLGKGLVKRVVRQS